MQTAATAARVLDAFVHLVHLCKPCAQTNEQGKQCHDPQQDQSSEKHVDLLLWKTKPPRRIGLVGVGEWDWRGYSVMVTGVPNGIPVNSDAKRGMSFSQARYRGFESHHPLFLQNHRHIKPEMAEMTVFYIHKYNSKARMESCLH